ncbi:MAG: hypothetical protein AB7D29_06930 [Campylobacterales bacterium]
MVSVNNFISFLTLNGFFVGILFAVLKLEDPFLMVVAVIFITAFFYMIALAAAAFFIKNVTFEPRYRIKKDRYETAIDSAIMELEKREVLIRDMYEFVKQLEEEEYEDMRRDSAQAVQAAKRRF